MFAAFPPCSFVHPLLGACASNAVRPAGGRVKRWRRNPTLSQAPQPCLSTTPPLILPIHSVFDVNAELHYAIHHAYQQRRRSPIRHSRMRTCGVDIQRAYSDPDHSPRLPQAPLNQDRGLPLPSRSTLFFQPHISPHRLPQPRLYPYLCTSLPAPNTILVLGPPQAWQRNLLFLPSHAIVHSSSDSRTLCAYRYLTCPNHAPADTLGYLYSTPFAQSRNLPRSLSSLDCTPRLGHLGSNG